MEDPYYCTPVWKAEEPRRLLYLAVLPLLDGFFLAFLATGLWKNGAQAIAFGLTAFSGAGCIVAAMRLRGTWWQRLVQISVMYAAIGGSAGVISIFRPFFQSIMPANFHLFTGIFLLGLGLAVSGVGMLRRIANWFGFETLVKAMLLASVISAIINTSAWRFDLDFEPLGSVILAVVAGWALSSSGALFGLWLGKEPDQRPLNWGAGASLVLMGLTVLGFKIPSLWVVTPLLLGCIAVVVLYMVHLPRSAARVPTEP